MPDKYPLANGNWSDATNWNDGTKPVPGDDVFADGRTVTIDEDVEVASIRTTQRSGGTAGGGFTLNAGITVIGDIITGVTTCITRTSIGPDSFVFGNCTGGTAFQGFCIVNSSAGTLHIVGNVIGGTGNTNSRGVGNTSSGTLNVTGNVIGGSGNTTVGVFSTSVGVVNITGDVTGGSGGTAFGVLNESTGTVNIIGNAIGTTSSAVRNTGTVNITGDIITGTVSGYQATANTGVLNHNGNGICSPSGIHWAMLGIYRLNASATIQHTYISEHTGPARSLYTGGINLGQPVEADVRFGTDYGAADEYTGTLRIPAPQFVSQGVLTDDTVGTLGQPTAESLGIPGLISSIGDVLSIESSPNLLSNPVWESFVHDGNIVFTKDNLVITSRENGYALRRIQTKFFNITSCTIKPKTDESLTWGPAIAVQNSSQSVKIGTRGPNKLGVFVNGTLREIITQYDQNVGVMVRIVADRKNIIAQFFDSQLNRWTSVGQILDFDNTSYIVTVGKSDQFGNATNWPDPGFNVECEISNFILNNFNSCR